MRLQNSGAEPLVILHGLLGSSRNWSAVGKSLQEHFDVHLLDLRNHGRSPHAESMRWAELSGDVLAYLDHAELDSVVLLGHSLGGKIAMRVACDHPQRVRQLVVVDIAAKVYPPYHEAEFRAMKRIELGELASRKEAEQLLEADVANWAMRQFLLTNLVRDPDTGAFRWQVNLKALHASLPHIRGNSLDAGDRYEGPVLLLRGGQSDFIADGDVDTLRQWFPDVRESTLEGAGHNVHVEDRDGFLLALIDTL
ncbi:MAG: alpha/beta fold hydrolase [Coraliomargaritaceae bacterium]